MREPKTTQIRQHIYIYSRRVLWKLARVASLCVGVLWRVCHAVGHANLCPRNGFNSAPAQVERTFNVRAVKKVKEWARSQTRAYLSRALRLRRRRRRRRRRLEIKKLNHCSARRPDNGQLILIFILSLFLLPLETCPRTSMLVSAKLNLLQLPI